MGGGIGSPLGGFGNFGGGGMPSLPSDTGGDIFNDPSTTGDLSGGFGGGDPGAFGAGDPMSSFGGDFPDMGGGVDPTGSQSASYAINPPTGPGGSQSWGDAPGAPAGPFSNSQPNQQAPQHPDQPNIPDIIKAFEHGPDSISGTPGAGSITGSQYDTGPYGGQPAGATRGLPPVMAPGDRTPQPNVPTPQPRPASAPQNFGGGSGAPIPPRAPPLDTAGNIPQPQPRPPLDTAGNVPMPRPAPGQPPAGSTDTAAGGGAGAGGADQSGAAGPATEMGGGGGRMPQSPLEQILGQFMQMLLGGGRGGPLGPFEKMLAHALGIPLPRFPQFPGNPLNQPVGPGQYPPGARGGRPGTPQAPGQPETPPSATRPFSESDEELANQYQNQSSAPDGNAPAGSAQSYVSPNSIAASKVAGSDTRPTPGFSATMRDARARAFQGMDDQTKKLVAGMAASEMANDPIGPIESLFNRSAHTGIPVRNLLYNGFYAHTAPKFAARAIQLQNSGQMGRFMAAIDAVQRGSNVLAGATDQGSAKLNDPNSRNRSGMITRYDEVYNDHTPASANWRRQIQQRVLQEQQAGL